MEYNFREIEKRWQDHWRETNAYKVVEDPNKPPFYVLDMFPYPSGAGLHVGHPLGYIASDIYARYKRLLGYNVLHPMGYDAFGLPTEQYAIQTGQHPEVTTKVNTDRYRTQLDKIGFSFDWSRECLTSDPEYYHWTQWIFLRLFNHYYDLNEKKAKPITQLLDIFAKEGNINQIGYTSQEVETFTAEDWKKYTEKEKQDILMNYRLAFLGDSLVNWCPKLGTVLANDEVSEGVSLRGGHPVVQRKMKQWCLRVSAYAERLLNGLDTLQWSDSIKETQRNWIGKSEGAEIRFNIEGVEELPYITVFTTRADTIYGVTFMVLAPESDTVKHIVTPEQQPLVEEYIKQTKRKTERERMMDKKVSGVFSGRYAINPLTNERIPIWISDYVLVGYGTGAIMAVPAHDTRDFAFARHFHLPIKQVVVPCNQTPSDAMEWEEAQDSKDGTMINSPLLDNLTVKDAIKKMKEIIKTKGLGKVKTNYRLRDAIFSRQRYWGEPIPIYYKNGIPTAMSDDNLPLLLPEIDKFLPTEEGEPPLARAKEWKTKDGYPYELSTMPGFAGSSAYYLRYMDPKNKKELVSKEKNEYWKQVNVYIGGTEHATGHLIYSRFWNKFLFDIGVICTDEPFQKLINQGMIQGRSNFVYRIKDTNTFVSAGLKDQYDTTEIHVDVNIVNNDKLDIEAFKSWREEFRTAKFILEDDQYICGWAVEKMSKSLFNVVNPDTIINDYGADTLRLYEMFLGPLEQSKPWDTNGIDGVHRFLKKLWALFFDNNGLKVADIPATKSQLKVVHKLIKKVSEDIEAFSFNTSVSQFMITVNDFSQNKVIAKEALRPLIITLSPFAPHIAEELWHSIGENGSVLDAKWPEYKEEYLVDDTIIYPISFNGKTRFTLELDANLGVKDIEAAALSAPEAAKWIDGKTPKKIIVIPGKIVNIVL